MVQCHVDSHLKSGGNQGNKQGACIEGAASFSELHRPYLLSHKYRIGDAKTDKGDGDQGDHMGDDHIDTLREGELSL